MRSLTNTSNTYKRVSKTSTFLTSRSPGAWRAAGLKLTEIIKEKHTTYRRRRLSKITSNMKIMKR
jgi:hypothetical protein